MIWITKTPDTSSVAETLPVIVAGPAVVSTILGEKLKSVNCGGVVSLCDDLDIDVVVVVGAAVVVVGVEVVVVAIVVTQVPLESHVPPVPHRVPAFGVTVQEEVPLHVRVLH